MLDILCSIESLGSIIPPNHPVTELDARVLNWYSIALILFQHHVRLEFILTVDVPGL